MRLRTCAKQMSWVRLVARAAGQHLRTSIVWGLRMCAPNGHRRERPRVGAPLHPLLAPVRSVRQHATSHAHLRTCAHMPCIHAPAFFQADAQLRVACVSLARQLADETTRRDPMREEACTR